MADRVITVTDPSIVTNDTLIGYNNYSDQDGQLGTTMTPTEATNGHTVALSDGVVHSVTTKPVGTTNGEFSAVVSNAVTVDLIPQGGWDLTGATYDSVSLNVSAQGDQPLGMFFSNNGEKMYLHQNNPDDKIDEFNLGTPWLLSSAVFSQSLATPSGGQLEAGLFFHPLGTKVFYINRTDGDVIQQTLSLAWDISTAQGETNFTTTSTNPVDLHMNSDGTRMYITNKDDALIEQWTLPTPYDVTSAVTRVTFDASGQDTGFHGIFFSTDGTRMFLQGETDGTVYAYNLTAWDITSCVADNSLSVSGQDSSAYGLYIKPDGLKLLMTGITTTPTVYQYSLT